MKGLYLWYLLVHWCKVVQLSPDKLLKGKNIDEISKFVNFLSSFAYCLLKL